MKKKLSLLLFIFIMMLVIGPFVVKADIGAPDVRPVEMVVTSPEGIDYYNDYKLNNKAGHLNKDDIFSVSYEYGGTISITVGGEGYYVSDIFNASVKKEYLDPTKESDNYIKKLDKPANVLVYDSHGVELKKGPSYRYETLATIKKGTKLSYVYYIDGGLGATHVFVEYNGDKGWIEILNRQVLLENETEEYIARNDVEMICGKIPKNTILKPKYKTDFWSLSAFFNYDNCTDMISVFKSQEMLLVDKVYAYAKTDLDVYQYSGNEGEKLTTIPNGAKFIKIAHFANYTEPHELYVSYNGVEGWIKTVYENFEITEEAAELPKVEAEKTEQDIDKDIISENEIDPKNSNATKDSKKNPEEFILICVIIGLSVSLAAVITIMIINQKKNKKKLDQVKSLMNEVKTKEKEVETKEEDKDKVEVKDEV